MMIPGSSPTVQVWGIINWPESPRLIIFRRTFARVNSQVSDRVETALQSPLLNALCEII